jgi:hypothetical protein
MTVSHIKGGRTVSHIKGGRTVSHRMFYCIWDIYLKLAEGTY